MQADAICTFFTYPAKNRGAHSGTAPRSCIAETRQGQEVTALSCCLTEPGEHKWLQQSPVPWLQQVSRIEGPRPSPTLWLMLVSPDGCDKLHTLARAGKCEQSWHSPTPNLGPVHFLKTASMSHPLQSPAALLKPVGT